MTKPKLVFIKGITFITFLVKYIIMPPANWAKLQELFEAQAKCKVHSFGVIRVRIFLFKIKITRIIVHKRNGVLVGRSGIVTAGSKFARVSEKSSGERPLTGT